MRQYAAQPPRFPSPPVMTPPTPGDGQLTFDLSVAGGIASILGGLTSLGALAFPWLHVQAIFLNLSLSLPDIVDLERQIGTDMRHWGIIALFLILAVLGAALTGIAGGIICIVANGMTLRIAGIAVAAAGVILFQSTVLFVIFITLANTTSSVGSVRPAVGVLAALGAFVLMAAGGSATTVKSILRRPAGTIPSR